MSRLTEKIRASPVETDKTHVVIAAGIVNVCQGIRVSRSEVRALVTAARSRFPTARVSIATVAPKITQSEDDRVALAELNETIRVAAGECGAQCIDLGGFAMSRSNRPVKALFRDRVHFTEHGSRLLAQAIVTQLN